MKKLYYFCLIACFACCELPNTGDNCITMTISDALPIQFWLNGEQSYNQLPSGKRVQKYCFNQEFECDDEIRLQFVEPNGGDFTLRFIDDQTGETLEEIPFTQEEESGEELFPDLGDFALEAGSGQNWTIGFFSQPRVTLENPPAPFATSDKISHEVDLTSGVYRLTRKASLVVSVYYPLNEWTNDGGGSSSWNTGVFPDVFVVPPFLSNKLHIDLVVDMPAGEYILDINITDTNSGPPDPAVTTFYFYNNGSIVASQVLSNGAGTYNISVPGIFDEYVIQVDNSDGFFTNHVTINSYEITQITDEGQATLSLQFYLDNVLKYTQEIDFDGLDTLNLQLDDSADEIKFIAENLSAFHKKITLNTFGLVKLQSVYSISFVASDLGLCDKKISLQIINNDGGDVVAFTDAVLFSNDIAENVKVEYRAQQNMLGIVYNEYSDYFMIRIPGVFFHPRYESTQATIKLTNRNLSRAWSLAKGKLLAIQDCPEYMHDKIQEILSHSVGGQLLINGVLWSISAGYEMDTEERPDTYPMYPASTILMRKNFFKQAAL